MFISYMTRLKGVIEKKINILDKKHQKVQI